jgi:hypothetical protein
MEMYKIKIISLLHDEHWQCPEFIISPVIPRIGEKISIPWVCLEGYLHCKKGYIDRDSYDEVIEVIYRYDDNNNFDSVTIIIEQASQ